MLLNKTKFVQFSLCIVLFSSDVYAMDERYAGRDDKYGTCTPVHSKKSRKTRGKVAKKKPLKTISYESEINRVWGLFEVNTAEDEIIDLQTAKFAFERVAEGLPLDKKFEVLNFFLARSNDAYTFGRWLDKIEQASDGTPNSKYSVFTALAASETPQ